MEQTRLFSDLPVKLEGKPGEATRPQDALVVHPVRNQIQFLMQDLDATLPEDHQARAIWEFLDRLDLSAFYASIQAVEGGPGRPASDPKCCWRSGYTLQWREWAAPGSWTGCAGSTMPIVGCAGACQWTTTCCRTFAGSTKKP